MLILTDLKSLQNYWRKTLVVWCGVKLLCLFVKNFIKKILDYVIVPRKSLRSPIRRAYATSLQNMSRNPRMIVTPSRSRIQGRQSHFKGGNTELNYMEQYLAKSLFLFVGGVLEASYQRIQKGHLKYIGVKISLFRCHPFMFKVMKISSFAAMERTETAEAPPCFLR